MLVTFRGFTHLNLERALKENKRCIYKVAQYRKKHEEELKKDIFRDKTLDAVEKLGDRLEGKGPLILRILAAIVAVSILLGVWTMYRNKKSSEATQAFGRVVDFANAQITDTPPAGPNADPTFPTEKDRAQRTIHEADKVIAKYGNPYKDRARYLSATSQLALDRNKGISELEALTKSDVDEVALWSKFALAQAKEADGQYDAAASIYQELNNQASSVSLPSDTIKFRLASVYEKQGKNKEAVELLFGIVESSRKPKDGKEGADPRPSVVADDAAKKLEVLDPARFAQLPPQPARAGFPMM
jgi:tetratricopeptide (TPR) repeat protein